MNKKTLLITSGIIALSLLNASNVQAEEELTPPTEETISNVLTDNKQENINQLSEEEEEIFNNIIAEMEGLLNNEQKDILSKFLSAENELDFLFKKAVLTHESGDFNQANYFYNNIIENLDETNTVENNDEIKNLIELFNELAKDNLSVLDFEYHQEISSQDLDEEDNVEEEKQAEPEEVDKNEEISTDSEQDGPQENKSLNANKTESTANELYNQILKAKNVSEAWNLAQEFKSRFPDNEHLKEAMNHAAQMSLNYGIKVHKRGEYKNAASYYSRVVNEEKVSATLKQIAQGYLNQAKEDNILKTSKDYYNKILKEKSTSRAWNLAQEFKENFPDDVLLGEAMDHAAQMNLDYGMKVHKWEEYKNAASYYSRVVNEEKVSATLKQIAQGYLNQAKEDNILKTPKDYYNKVLKEKSTSGAWNLAQEFKENFPGDALLGEAMNHAAQMNLDYGMKVHKRGEYKNAASYYSRIVEEEKVSTDLKKLAQSYLNQAKENATLKTPKDYYNKILREKSASGAWNLAQEFKENFPDDALLGEAMNHAAQMNLDYGMKVHERGEYKNAASYYSKLISEENVSSKLKSTANVYLKQANANEDLKTPSDYYNKIVTSKKVSEAWDLAQEFKGNFPDNILLSEAFNHAAQMNLDYAMKLHMQKNYTNASSYYERIINEKNVSDNLKSTAKVYLEQAKSKQELTTPKDYLKQIKNSKNVSDAWNLAQKFKANFPNDSLLNEAMNFAAEMNLQYAIKLHKNGEYLNAASYYNRVTSEKIVDSSIQKMAKTFKNLAKQEKKILSANNYVSKIKSSKSVSESWNLAQEALLIYPGHSSLINALNETANDNLSYGRKIQKQGKSELARSYYEKVNNDPRIDSQIRHLAKVFIGQTYKNHQPVVYIDSGHGGTDSGASFYGAYEKKLNLNVAKYLKSDLEKRGYTVIMSREKDTFVPLTDRALEANKLGADIFVSVHHNSMGGSGTGKGIETFLFHKVASGFGQETNRNNFKLNDPRISESLNLADNVHSNLIKSTGMYDRGVKGNNFNVLRNTHIPAILVELGFIDNRSELTIINSTSYQKNAASAMANGIDKYFTSISK